MRAPRIAFVLKGYPRLSETFIAQEIRALEQRGLPILIVSLRHPTDAKRHPLHDEIEAERLYLPEYLHLEAGRVLRGWWRSRRQPGFGRALRTWLADLRRDRSRNRIRRFGQALVLAAELPEDVDLLHAHFLHTPASVTRYTALILRRSWSCSAHARDIWTSQEWEKHEKLASCRWCVTCTGRNLDHLRSLSDRPHTLELLYHGLDLVRFPHFERPASAVTGDSATQPVRILSVGRAVEKKGYDVLLHALTRLPSGLHWRFDHVGGGADAGQLACLAEELRLGDKVTWHGPQAQREVLDHYRKADLFVLASRTAADGDQDGLPNVIVEAQSQALPCVATRLSAIPELIDDGYNGRLVPANDARLLAAAIAELALDPGKRVRFGRAGEARVRGHFSLVPGIDRLAERFQRDRGTVPLSSASADADRAMASSSVS